MNVDHITLLESSESASILILLAFARLSNEIVNRIRRRLGWMFIDGEKGAGKKLEIRKMQMS